MDQGKFANRLSAVLQVGATARDSRHAVRVKMMYTATMLAAAVYSLLIALAPDRTAIERAIDVFAVVMCLVTVLVLHVTKSTHTTFALAFVWIMTVLAGYYFIHGTRDGDMFFVMLLPVAAVAFFGPRRSLKYLVASIVAVVLIVVFDTMLPRISHDWNLSPANPDAWLFHGTNKTTFQAIETVTFFSVMLILYALSYAGAGALWEANKKGGDPAPEYPAEVDCRKVDVRVGRRRS